MRIGIVVLLVLGAAFAKPASIDVTGRIVGAGRFAVADARVRLQWPDGRTVEARSAADGSFRFRAIPDPPLRERRPVLHAKKAGESLLFLVPRGGRCGVLPLLESWNCAVKVTEDGEVRPEARVRLELFVDGAGASWVVGAEKNGVANFGTMPRANGSVHAWAPGCADFTEFLPAELPRKALPVRMQDGVDTGVRVRDAGSGKPIAGAALRVFEVWRDERMHVPSEHFVERRAAPIPAPTDADGRTRVPGLARDKEYEFVVRKDGIEIATARSTAVDELVIDVAHVVRWRVEGKAPPDGTTLVARVLPGTNSWHAVQARMRDGQIELRGVPAAEAFGCSVVHEKRIAILYTDRGEASHAARFFDPAHATLRVLNPKGAPLSSGSVLLRDRFQRGYGQLELDAEGRVRFEQLPLRGQFGVYWIASDGERVALGDLRVPDVKSKTYRLRRPRFATLRFLVDGKPHLPRRLTVTGSIAEDPAKGSVGIRMRENPGAAFAYVQCTATGYTPVSFELGGEPAAPTIDIPLRREAVVRVEAAEGELLAKHLSLVSWHPKFEAIGWKLLRPAHPWEGPNLAKHEERALLPGTYRVLDSRSRWMSRPFKVGPGALHRVHIPSKRHVWVTGRVALPPGVPATEVSVLFDRDTLPQYRSHRGRLDGEGRFRLRVPNDGKTTLRAWHGSWVGAPVAVGERRNGIVLPLKKADLLRFQPTDARGAALDNREFTVRLFEGDPEGKPVWSARSEIRAREAALPHAPAGRHTLWIHVAPFAPVVVCNAVTGRNLGRIRMPDGARLRLRLKGPPGVRMAPISVYARPLRGIMFVRGGYQDREDTYVVRGLVPGPHELLIRPDNGPLAGRQWTFRVDVEERKGGEQMIEFDLTSR